MDNFFVDWSFAFEEDLGFTFKKKRETDIEISFLSFFLNIKWSPYLFALWHFAFFLLLTLRQLPKTHIPKLKEENYVR